MFTNRADAPPPAFPFGISAWRALVWSALAVYLFNFWIMGWHQWSNVLYFEVPSRTAIHSGHLWTVLTYVLTSARLGSTANWFLGLLSIGFLFVVSRLVETELTPKDFILLCSSCALGGVVLWLPLHWFSDEQLLSGCAVLVLGLLSFWCFAIPDEPVSLRLFFIVDARPQEFFWLALALETGVFLSFELPQILGHPGIFHANFDNSAHIGGMLAGWAFASYWRHSAWDDLDIQSQSKIPPRARPAAVPVGVGKANEQDRGAAPGGRSSLATRREMREELDRILDKINHEGLDSLSAQERQTLAEAKNFLGK